MKLKDFTIGGYFYTATGRWYCIDIATKHILAVNADEEILLSSSHEDTVLVWDDLSETERQTLLEPKAFSEDDFGGCRLEEIER
jgi:hypothetical protein